MAAKQANFRMEPGSDAMKQRMQAMMRYNRLRQETRASNAVLQVKRKHQRREAVDPRADEDSLERQQMQDAQEEIAAKGRRVRETLMRRYSELQAKNEKEVSTLSEMMLVYCS